MEVNIEDEDFPRNLLQVGAAKDMAGAKDTLGRKDMAGTRMPVLGC